jgi:hypothetical protein
LALNWPPKSPGERLDYTINWANALGTDTITLSSWTISAADLTTDSNTFAPRTSTIWLLGGTPAQTYTVTNTITTAGGRIFVQAVNISVVTAS